LYGVDANATNAHHGNRVAGPDLGIVHHSAKPRRNSTTNQRGDGKGNVICDNDTPRLRHDRKLGER
jgi:hypothetical protein